MPLFMDGHAHGLPLSLPLLLYPLISIDALCKKKKKQELRILRESFVSIYSEIQ